MKPAHHSGRFQTDGQHLRTLGNNNPQAICWRDGQTLNQHPPGDKWTAGHTIDSYPNPPAWWDVTRQPPPGPWLALEASSCNYANGAHRTNRHRNNPRSMR